MNTRICRVCGVEKSLDEFYLRKDIGLHRKECKSCFTQQVKNRTYGISTEVYQAMLKSQECRCAVCGVHQDELPKSLHVDHCHVTGKVRGLLCQFCNFGLGYFKDHPERLQAASAYLSSRR